MIMLYLVLCSLVVQEMCSWYILSLVGGWGNRQGDRNRDKDRETFGSAVEPLISSSLMDL